MWSGSDIDLYLLASSEFSWSVKQFASWGKYKIQGTGYVNLVAGTCLSDLKLKFRWILNIEN